MTLKLSFARHLKEEVGLFDSTIQQYIHRCLTWERLTGKPMREITADDARAVKRDPSVSPAYTKNLIVTLRSFHKFGAAEGYWELNGIMLVGMPRRIEHNTPPALSLTDARMLLGVCRSPLEFRLIYLGLYTGMRIGESASIRQNDWKWDKLWFRHEKTRRFGEMPIHPVLESVKGPVLARSPSDGSGFKRAKEALIERAGFHFVAHQLRRTFATLLYDAEVPDEVVGDLLGHSGNVTRLYAGVSSDKRKRAIEMLPY